MKERERERENERERGREDPIKIIIITLIGRETRFSFVQSDSQK